MNPVQILLVENEQKIASTLKMGVTENGYRVEVAQNTKTALSLFNSHYFDLIIIDIDNPQDNFLSFCRTVRERRHVPIIILTTLISWSNKIEGFDIRPEDFMLKPFEFHELQIKIEAMLHNPAGNSQPDNQLLVGDLEMDLKDKLVRRGGRLIILSVMESRLLEYLIRNKNKLVSHNDIAVDVLGIDSGLDKKDIDSYINYLRNKMDKSFGKSLIKIVPGEGFILTEGW